MMLFFRWLLKSSVDSQKWSLTIKGLAVSTVPLIIAFGHVANIQFESDTLTKSFDTVANLVFYAGALVSTFVTLIGLARKIATSLLGENDVLEN